MATVRQIFEIFCLHEILISSICNNTISFSQIENISVSTSCLSLTCTCTSYINKYGKTKLSTKQNTILKPSSKMLRRYFFCGSFMFLFCLVFAMSLCASIYMYMCFVVTCWERADLLALVCGVFCEFVTFPLVSWVRCGT